MAYSKASTKSSLRGSSTKSTSQASDNTQCPKGHQLTSRPRRRVPEADRQVPPVLWYLAGGRGPPITCGQLAARNARRPVPKFGLRAALLGPKCLISGRTVTYPPLRPRVTEDVSVSSARSSAGSVSDSPSSSSHGCSSQCHVHCRGSATNSGESSCEETDDSISTRVDSVVGSDCSISPPASDCEDCGAKSHQHRRASSKPPASRSVRPSLSHKRQNSVSRPADRHHTTSQRAASVDTSSRQVRNSQTQKNPPKSSATDAPPSENEGRSTRSRRSTVSSMHSHPLQSECARSVSTPPASPDLVFSSSRTTSPTPLFTPKWNLSSDSTEPSPFASKKPVIRLRSDFGSKLSTTGPIKMSSGKRSVSEVSSHRHSVPETSSRRNSVAESSSRRHSVAESSSHRHSDAESSSHRHPVVESLSRRHSVSSSIQPSERTTRSHKPPSSVRSARSTKTEDSHHSAYTTKTGHTTRSDQTTKTDHSVRSSRSIQSSHTHESARPSKRLAGGSEFESMCTRCRARVRLLSSSAGAGPESDSDCNRPSPSDLCSSCVFNALSKRIETRGACKRKNCQCLVIACPSFDEHVDVTEPLFQSQLRDYVDRSISRALTGLRLGSDVNIESTQSPFALSAPRRSIFAGMAKPLASVPELQLSQPVPAFFNPSASFSYPSNDVMPTFVSSPAYSFSGTASAGTNHSRGSRHGISVQSVGSSRLSRSPTQITITIPGDESDPESHSPQSAVSPFTKPRIRHIHRPRLAPPPAPSSPIGTGSLRSQTLVEESDADSESHRTATGRKSLPAAWTFGSSHRAEWPRRQFSNRFLPANFLSQARMPATQLSRQNNPYKMARPLSPSSSSPTNTAPAHHRAGHHGTSRSRAKSWASSMMPGAYFDSSDD